MIKRLMGGLAVPLLGIALAFLANKAELGALKMFAGQQLGLDLGENDHVAVCVNGEIEETYRCFSPYPNGIDNYCDFIGCDQVSEAATNTLQNENSSEFHCGAGTLFTGIPEDKLVDVQLGVRGKKLRDDLLACTRPIFCMLGDVDMLSNCQANDVDFAIDFDGPFGIPDLGGEFLPITAGFCDPFDDTFFDDPIPGWCRRCVEKESYSPEEVNIVADFTSKAKWYVPDNDCIEVPGLAGGLGGGLGGGGLH